MVAPCEVRILHPLAPQKRPTFVPRMTPGVGEAPRENAALWTSGGAPTRVPKPSRSDQFYVPEFAELTRVVLVAQKGHVIEQRPGQGIRRLSPRSRLFVPSVRILGVIHARRREMP